MFFTRDAHFAWRLKLFPALVSASRTLRLTILDALIAISYGSTDTVMLALASKLQPFFSAGRRRTLNPSSLLGSAECECRNRYE